MTSCVRAALACLAVLPLWGAGLEARACTAFAGGGLVAKGYDWDIGYGLVLVNPKGLKKRALAFHPTDRPFEWVAEHASLTFNQYGRELPNGGINDAGLVVEVLWLGESAYPPPDSRPTVNELQWVQLMLDRYATTGEVVGHAGDVRISLVAGKVHYFVCDAARECAVLEHVGQKLVVTAAAALGARAITNNTWTDSAARLRQIRGFGGTVPPPGRSAKSLDRYVQAAFAARHLDITAGTDVAAAFRLLGRVAVGKRTQWNIVYDLEVRRVHFKTQAAPAVKQVDLAAVVSDCAAPVRALDIDHAVAGDVAAAFAPLTRAQNLALIQRSMSETRRPVPREAGTMLAAYPESFSCVGSTPAAAGRTRAQADGGELD